MKPYDVEDLRFEYPGRFRMQIDRLQVEPGEKLAVVGENGSGKTTLLRILGFLERPTSFVRFHYRGKPVPSRRVDRDSLGFLRQQPWIFSGSVADNLAFGLRVRGRSRREIKRRVETLCKRLDLTPWMDAPARSLSGGQQKRLALGRVLISEPEVLLLDEPTAHLDRASRRIIRGILAETPAAVVVTTHDPAFALGLPRRTLTLEAGRIEDREPGSILEDYADGPMPIPRSRIVASLPLGTRQMLRSEVSGLRVPRNQPECPDGNPSRVPAEAEPMNPVSAPLAPVETRR